MQPSLGGQRPVMMRAGHLARGQAGQHRRDDRQHHRSGAQHLAPHGGRHIVAETPGNFGFQRRKRGDPYVRFKRKNTLAQPTHKIEREPRPTRSGDGQAPENRSQERTQPASPQRQQRRKRFQSDPPVAAPLGARATRYSPGNDDRILSPLLDRVGKRHARPRGEDQ